MQITIANGVAGANDVLTGVAIVSGTSCGRVSGSVPVQFGTVDLGSPLWGSTDLTFQGTGSNSSELQWAAGTNTLTIVLGSRTGTAGNVTTTTVTATYTPSSLVTDAAGNAAAGSATTTTKL